jgi:hypothetical protein
MAPSIAAEPVVFGLSKYVFLPFLFAIITLGRVCSIVESTYAPADHFLSSYMLRLPVLQGIFLDRGTLASHISV